MQDFVSTRWIRVVGLVASMSVVCAILIRYDLPWMGLVGASLVLAAALWLGMRPTRSLAQVIDEIEGEPVLAVAVSVPVAQRRRSTPR